MIIPVFNGSNYIKEAIESVHTQKYPNIEIVVVDDGSTDETWAILQSMKKNVRSFHKENGGVASALNYGIKNANGDFIAWLSHDDLFLPEKILKQIEYLDKHTDTIACFTDFVIVDENLKKISEFHSSSFSIDNLVEELFPHMFINGSTMLIRKECFNKYGYFDEKLKNTQDAEYWVRIACDNKIGSVPEPLLLSRTHPTQGSGNYKKQLEEEKNTFLILFSRPEVRKNILKSQQKTEESSNSLLALQYEWFGDAMRLGRRWYCFSIQMYDQAIALSKSQFRILIKKILAHIQLVFWGNEDTTQIEFKMVNSLVLGSTNKNESKKVIIKFLRMNPLFLPVYKLILNTYIFKYKER